MMMSIRIRIHIHITLTIKTTVDSNIIIIINMACWSADLLSSGAGGSGRSP